MNRPSPSSKRRQDRRHRRGFSWTGAVVLLTILAALPVAAYFAWPFGSDKRSQAGPLTHRVQKAAFQHVISERGEIESSSNVDVRCEVQSRTGGSGGGSVILEIVPEGTYVQQGDLLVRLDSSALRDELVRQQITCNTSRAAVIQAQATLETAKIARQEYLEGTYKQEEQLFLSELAVAEEDLRRNQDYVRYSEVLASKGYVTPLQLEADRFAVTKSEMDVATATTKIDVLRNYTRKKMLAQLDADISTAEANLESQQQSHQLDLDQLKLIEDQIAKCTIYAPTEGQVVYATPADRRGGDQFVVEEGAVVRERQVIVRLPDPKHMRVKAEINEARIDMVRPGLPAMIRVDALPDIELEGTVTKVDEYPVGSSWWSTVKKYASYVEIHDPPQGLRPGMTAEVRIHVKYAEDVLQVPVQAVLERHKQHFCVVRTPEGLVAKEVQIGATNERFVVINDGISENDVVVMNPRSVEDQVDLPQVNPNEMLARAPRTPPTETETQSSGDQTSGGAGADRPADSSDGEVRTAGGANVGGGGEVAAAARGDSALGNPGQMFDQLDKDGDGKLSREEAPEMLKGRFDDIDTNNDGFIDRAELTKAINAFRQMIQAQGGPGGGGVAGGAGR